MRDCLIKKYRKYYVSQVCLNILALLIFISILSCAFVASVAVDITLAWGASSGADGYRLFCREKGQSYNNNTPDWNGSVRTCTRYALDDLATYHFVGRAYNSHYVSSGLKVETYQPPTLTPSISLSANSLPNSSTEGSDAPSQTCGHWNSVGDALSYSTSDNRSWLSCSPSNTNSAGAQGIITVSYRYFGFSRWG